MAPPTDLSKAPEWRLDIEGMANEFMRSLGKQVPTDRFVRTIITAMQANPDLAEADRRSLKLACMKAAEDGLLPDGREGALVIYNTKVKDKKTGKDVWIKQVQWQPMVWGLVKKARGSGEIVSITSHVVFRHDDWHRRYGDEETFVHEPIDVDDEEMTEENAIGAYAIAHMKDGTKIRAWRSKRHIMLAKSKSKAQSGMLWNDFWEEGWQKTVIRYLAKYLPRDSQTEGFARAAERDDEQFDFDRAKDVTPARTRLERFVENQQVAAEANGDDDHAASIPGDTRTQAQRDHDQQQEDRQEFPGGPRDPEHDPATGELPLDDTSEPEPEERRIPVIWSVGGRQVLLLPVRALELWAEKSAGKQELWKHAVLNRNPELAALVQQAADG